MAGGGGFSLNHFYFTSKIRQFYLSILEIFKNLINESLMYLQFYFPNCLDL